MKEGRSLTELAQEIERQAQAKRDFIVDDSVLGFNVRTDFEKNRKHVTADIIDASKGESFNPNDNFHAQVSSKLQIPKRYYDRMLAEEPELLCRNVNTWLGRSDEKHLVRTLDGKARAFLSDRYRRIDNFELAEAILPVFAEYPDLDIKSCQLTETRMYIKAINRRIEGQVTKGDIVQAGVLIRNSEVGHSSLAVEPLLYRLACLNGMISADISMRKYHSGQKLESAEGSWEIFSNETKRQTDKALFLQLRDLTEKALSDALFQQQIEKLREAAGEEITKDPVKVVEELAKDRQYTDTERSGILQHLIRGGDLSKYGLANAVTRFSQDVNDYDRATDFEREGGKIIELNRNQWRTLAVA